MISLRFDFLHLALEIDADSLAWDAAGRLFYAIDCNIRRAVLTTITAQNQAAIRRRFPADARKRVSRRIPEVGEHFQSPCWPIFSPWLSKNPLHRLPSAIIPIAGSPAPKRYWHARIRGKPTLHLAVFTLVFLPL